MAMPWEEYGSPQAGPWADYAPAKEKPSFGQMLKEQVLDSVPAQAAMGGLRGSGSIGATLLRPFESGQENQQRRADMTQTLKDFGAQPDSVSFGAGKLGGEMAGTAGVGQALALPFKATNAFPAFQTALGSAGMTTGLNPATFAGKAGDLGLRTLAGGATGYGMAGLVDPETANTGAAVGAALPGAVKAAGTIASGIGSGLRGASTAPNQQTLDTARRSMDAGYVIPPAMVNPSFKNRTLETLSGKYETAQLASTRNQEVTEGLVRKALGLAPDAPLSQAALSAYRGQQYKAGYEPVKALGDIPAGQKFNDALDDIVSQYTGKGTIPAIASEKKSITDLVNAHKSVGFDSADAVDAIRILREDANSAYAQGNGALGKATKAIANAYEQSIDDALEQIGQKDLLAAYRSARQNIAKAGTVEKGLREGSGVVDARALARELQKKKPLTDELRTVAEFGNVFRQAAQPPHAIGSPGVNTLKHGLATMSAGIGGAAFGPAGLGLGALNYVTPPAARSVMFSRPYQQGLLNPAQKAAGPIQGLLEEQMYRAAPLIYGQ